MLRLRWALAAIVTAGSSISAAEPPSVREFLADVSKQAAVAERAMQSVVAGPDGWLFFVPELRSLGAGRFWGDDAKRVSRASNPDYADPLPAIVDFRNQLHQAGIELLVVPVPAKAAVYPEAVSATVKAADDDPPPRVDPFQQEFYGLLKEQGVEVVDLLPIFLTHRDGDGGPLYCRTDSHWSGRGVSLAARVIADKIVDREWLKNSQRITPASETRDVAMTGDLARMLDERNPQPETLSLTFVGVGGELTPLAPDRDSPVLLMGDSHTLIFHDPALGARGAGLPDHFALGLGMAVDLIGVRGSGATTTRIELLRRKDNLRGKKLVVWCFSFREFTESSTGWRKVPVIR